MRRQPSPAEIMQFVQKMQDPKFRRQLRRVMQGIFTLAIAALSFLTLLVVIAVTMRSLTPAWLMGALASSLALGWGAGMWLTRRTLASFQSRLAEKGMGHLFRDF